MQPDIYSKIWDVLSSRNRFLITAHLRADGDAIASACFFGAVLTRMGKRFWMVLDESSPDDKYNYLECFELFYNTENLPGDFDPEVGIILDTPTRARLGKTAQFLTPDMQTINIDHHVSNKGFDGLDLVDSTASSTCEILVRWLRRYPEFMTPAVAEILYTGICFDTGRFRFSNTRAETLREAAYLVDNGASVENISERVFYQWSFFRAQIMGKILSRIQSIRDGKIVIFSLDHTFFTQYPDGWKELEGVSDLGISLSGVEVSLFMRELKPGAYKVSLRSRGKWDVRAAAALFGGGGHPKAAGCDISGSEKDVIRRLVDAIESSPMK
jgi:bifunctional oligoribonuclease and PAP phosphatase NrnA